MPDTNPWPLEYRTSVLPNELISPMSVGKNADVHSEVKVDFGINTKELHPVP